MPLFHTVSASRDDVAAIVKQHWSLDLGDELKASQNTTYVATDGASGRKYIVRATPDDADGRNAPRIADELAFVSFIAAEVADVPAPLPLRTAAAGASSDPDSHVAVGAAGSAAGPETDGGRAEAPLHVRERGVIVAVTEFARGAMLPYLDYRWMTDEAIVRATGGWYASFHAASRRFSAAHPTVAARMQRWDEMHSGVLADAPVAPADAAVEGDARHWGVLHGDVNPSNFFVTESPGSPPRLSVFDWDQAQRGWWLWDVAQSILGVVMLAEAGSVVDGSAVPQAKPAEFEEQLVAGYESVAGVGVVDRPRLARMVALRKYFYGAFCRRALDEGDVPAGMAGFLKFVTNWLDRYPVDLAQFN